jgi:hypothetical protein
MSKAMMPGIGRGNHPNSRRAAKRALEKEAMKRKGKPGASQTYATRIMARLNWLHKMASGSIGALGSCQMEIEVLAGKYPEAFECLSPARQLAIKETIALTSLIKYDLDRLIAKIKSVKDTPIYRAKPPSRRVKTP